MYYKNQFFYNIKVCLAHQILFTSIQNKNNSRLINKTPNIYFLLYVYMKFYPRVSITIYVCL